MKTSGRAVVLLLVFCSVISVAALAQTKLSSRPEPPIPIAPANKQVVYAPKEIPTVVFAWKPAPSGPTPEYYDLLFEDADDPGRYAGEPLRVQHTGDKIVTNQRLPKALRGRRIRWSVTACVGAKDTGDKTGAAGSCSGRVSRFLLWETRLRAPQLLSPEHGAAISLEQQFRWTGVTGAESYLLCVSRPGVACPKQETYTNDTYVLRRDGSTNTSGQPALDAFAGEDMNWTVAACDAGGYCVYQNQVRSLMWAAPDLRSPAHGAVIGVGERFRWSRVEWARSYLLCVSKPGVACPTRETSTGNTLVIRTEPVGNTAAVPDLGPFAGEDVNWTVAACSQSGSYAYSYPCRYQQQVRSLRFAPDLPIRIRNSSSHDVNEVWVAYHLAPDQPVRTLVTSDLSEYRPPRVDASGRQHNPDYDDEIVAAVRQRHAESDEPNVTPTHHVEFSQEVTSSSRSPQYRVQESVAFAPGVSHVAGYEIVRETLFLFESSSFPRTRFEQVLRGPDGRLYAYRPGSMFLHHPETDHGPVLLETLIREGYGAYDPAELNE